MSTQELFHLFLLWLSCFEVLSCESTEKDSLFNLTSVEEKVSVSESSTVFEESFTGKPKEIPAGSLYLNGNESDGSDAESFTPKLKEAPPQAGSQHFNRNESDRSDTESFTRRPREPLAGSRYLDKDRPNRSDREYLFDLMGDDFRPNFMAERRPKNSGKLVPLNEVSLNMSEIVLAQQKHVAQYEEYNFTYELAHLQPDLLPYENEIKSWLIRRASCPAAFRWRNLGPLFWPQWVRNGFCLEGECSLPFGMSCVPKNEIKLYFLRWKCEKRIKNHASSERTRCKWEKIFMPVVVACQCSC